MFPIRAPLSTRRTGCRALPSSPTVRSRLPLTGRARRGLLKTSFSVGRPPSEERQMTRPTPTRRGEPHMEKIWANSGDSHFLEPEDLWRSNLPAHLAELVPRSEKDADGQWETVHIDGMSFRRKLPTMKAKEFIEASNRAPGARDIELRMKDLDQEGIWNELVFPSLGMWSSAFRIGTDPIDLASGGSAGVLYRGPGGAVLNYTETTFGGQRAVMKMAASGALDRHENLKVLVSEGGATWVPFIADRMIEGYRQHAMAVKPKLKRDIKEIIYTQVYASFQHDESAVAVAEHLGYLNVMWGSDYPHMEGTYGHTQETLHGLFDGVDPKIQERVTVGAFNELFPGLSPLPTTAAA